MKNTLDEINRLKKENEVLTWDRDHWKNVADAHAIALTRERGDVAHSLELGRVCGELGIKDWQDAAEHVHALKSVFSALLKASADLDGEAFRKALVEANNFGFEKYRVP